MRDDSDRPGRVHTSGERQPSRPVRSGWFSRPPRLLLLREGYRVSPGRCCCCGKDFCEPRRKGEKFRLALALMDPDSLSPLVYRGATILVGSRVLIAAVASRWRSLLRGSTIFIGEKVLIATATAADGECRRYLLCGICGVNVVARTGGMNPYYAWDWLAEIRPRWFYRLTRQFPP